MTSVVRMLEGSKEFIRAPIAAEVAGVVEDIDGLVVEMAIRAVGDDTALDWETVAWETDTTTTPDTYYAIALIGVAPFVLAVGAFNVYVRISDNPEVPILHTGRLYIAAA